MHEQQNNLGVEVWAVPDSRVRLPVWGQHTILCSEALGVLWVEDDRQLSNIQDQEGCWKSYCEVDQVRFTFDQDRSPAMQKIDKIIQESVIKEAMRKDAILGSFIDSIIA